MVKSDLYRLAIDTFGKEHQLLVTMGEMAEASADIARHKIRPNEHDEQELIYELADVCIMMEQMQIIYGDRLIQAIHKKLKKLQKRIEDGDNSRK